MSSERIRIELTRDGDEWDARVTEHDVEQSLVGRDFAGSGPADALEQLGQALDELDVERIRRERDL